MKKKLSNGCRTQGARQLEVAIIDLHIRQLQAVIREHQSVINQLRIRKAEILTPLKKKRRRCQWDVDTPIIRLVNLQQLDYFKTMMDKWTTLTTETINPSKTYQFHFIPERRSYAIRALAIVLSQTPPVFKVSTLQLCRYLSTHSNLGTSEAIRQALFRMRKLL